MTAQFSTETINYVRPSFPVVMDVTKLGEYIAVVRFSQRVDFYRENARIASVYTPTFYLAKAFAMSADELLVLPVNSPHFLQVRADSFYFKAIALRCQVLDFYCSPTSAHIAILEPGSVVLLDKTDFSQITRFGCGQCSRLDCLCSEAGEITHFLLSGSDKLEIISADGQTEYIDCEGVARFVGDKIILSDGRRLQAYNTEGDLLAELRMGHFANEVLPIGSHHFVASGGITSSIVELVEDDQDIYMTATHYINSYASELAGACYSEGYICMFEKLAVARMFDPKMNHSEIVMMFDQPAPCDCAGLTMLRSAYGIDFLELGEQISIRKRLKAACNEQFFALVGGNEEIEAQRENVLITAFAGAPCGSYCVAYAGDYRTHCYVDQALVNELPMALGVIFFDSGYVFALPNGFLKLDDRFNPCGFREYAIGTRTVYLGVFYGYVFALLGGRQLLLLAEDLRIVKEVTSSDIIARATPCERQIMLVKFKKLTSIDENLQEIESRTFTGYLLNAHQIGDQIIRVNTNGWNSNPRREHDPLWYFDSVLVPGGLRLFARHYIFYEWDLVRVTDQNGRPYALLD